MVFSSTAFSALTNTQKHVGVQHIFIPGLFEPLDVWYRDFDFTASAPLLVKRLSTFKKNKHVNAGLLASIYTLLGDCADKDINSHADACYRFDFATDGADKAETMDVLCAAPIELEAGMSDIVIGHQVIDDLTVEEQQQLLTLLNKHFSQDGWEFVVSNKGNNRDNDGVNKPRWLLLLPKNTKPANMIPIHDALGASLRSLVEGVEDVQWSRQLNELQMLLYGSFTNQQRENNRQRTVSSFWLWDVIVEHEKTIYHKKAPASSVKFIAGGGYEGQVIANAYNLEWSEIPHTSHKPEESGIYIYDDLLGFAGRNDLDGWQDKLSELESFLVDLLDNGSTSTIIYSGNNSGDGFSWSSQKKTFLGFLRKPKKTLLDFL
ncbi:MAG: hypothetical protein V3U84_06415 [Thiotrichaceae bacterium]